MIDPESFRGKVLLLVIDKVIIGAAIGVVFLGFYLWSESRQQEVEERRLQQQLDLERATLAAQMLPSVADAKLQVDDRANLLTVLTEADAVRPGTAARLGQILLEAGVSERAFAQAIRPAMLVDVEPFVREVEPIVINWHRRSWTTGCPGRGDDRPAESDDAPIQWSHWRSAFTVYLELDSEPAQDQLNSEKFLGAYLLTLANLLSPGSSDQAHIFAESDVLAIKLIGHLALIAVDPRNPSSNEFIAKRLRRAPVTRSDVALLYQLVLALRDSPEVFNGRLRGEIAIPLSELLTSGSKFEDSLMAADWYWAQWNAGEALWRMSDCGVAAQGVLAAFLGQFVSELSRIDGDDALEQFARKHESGKLVRRVVDLLGTMEDRIGRPSIASDEAKASIRSILTVPMSKLRHFGFLWETAERYAQ